MLSLLHQPQKSVTLKQAPLCFWFVVVSLLINLSAYADNRGVSFIGQMCHNTSDCSVINYAFDNAEIINTGWLYGTFNATGCKCAPAILNAPRPKRVRLSICNGTCFPERGRRCHRFECFAGMNHRQASIAIAKQDPQLFARIDRIIAMAKADMAVAAAPVEWFIQPCLECSISRTARRRLTSYIAAQFPGLPIVDNPATDKCFPDYLCEKHDVVRGNSRTIATRSGTCSPRRTQRPQRIPLRGLCVLCGDS